jgi:hypothetical protein
MTSVDASVTATVAPRAIPATAPVAGRGAGLPALYLVPGGVVRPDGDVGGGGNRLQLIGDGWQRTLMTGHQCAQSWFSSLVSWAYVDFVPDRALCHPSLSKSLQEGRLADPTYG